MPYKIRICWKDGYILKSQKMEDSLMSTLKK